MTLENVTDFTTLMNVINAETYGFFPIISLLSFFSVSVLILSKYFKIPFSIFISLVFLLPFVAIFVSLNWLSGEALLIYLLILGSAGILAYLT